MKVRPQYFSYVFQTTPINLLHQLPEYEHYKQQSQSPYNFVLKLHRLTWKLNEPQLATATHTLQLLLIANSANAKHLRCSPESSSCTPQVICSRGVKQSSCRHSDPLLSGPISPPSSLVWPHGGKLLFSWLAFLLGEAAKPAAQSHKHKQVLPLSVAAASHQRSSAECRNRTFSFLISLSIFNWSHSPPSLPCRQLQRAAGNNGALHQASFPGKRHPQPYSKHTRSSWYALQCSPAHTTQDSWNWAVFPPFLSFRSCAQDSWASLLSYPEDCYFPAIAHVKQLRSQTASLIHKMSKEKGTDRSGEAAHRTASP